MSNSSGYFRTWDLQMRQRTHLEGIGDYTLCGLDTSGDDLVHGKDPEALGSGNHRVTCDHCLQLIEIVRRHLKAKQPALSRQLAERQWRPIESAPRDGSEVWAYNGEQGRMKWIEGEGFALWIWADELLADVDPCPEQPTHFQLLPPGPEGEGGNTP